MTMILQKLFSRITYWKCRLQRARSNMLSTVRLNAMLETIS